MAISRFRPKRASSTDRNVHKSVEDESKKRCHCTGIWILQRTGKVESRSLARCGVYPDSPSMSFYQNLADPEAKADTSDIVFPLCIKPLEWLEKSLLIFGRDPYSLIAYAYSQVRVIFASGNFDFPTFWRILDRVLNKVVENSLDSDVIDYC